MGSRYHEGPPGHPEKMHRRIAGPRPVIIQAPKILRQFWSP
jgi:hypothetical protein